MRRLLPIVLLLVLLAAPAIGWTAVITSAATGDFSTGATWVGGAAPAAGDSFVIANTHNVTLDGVRGGAGFVGGTVQNGGTLTIPTDATTGLIFTGDNSLTIDSGGTITMAGAGSLDPEYTCTITLTPATDGGAGLIINGTAVLKGAAKDHFRLLAADVGEWAASGDIATVANPITSITLDAEPSGWRDNDLLAIAPTGRTYSHWDTCLVNEDPVAGTAIAVDGWQGTAPLYAGAGTTSAWNHQGAGTPAQARAEVLNLTRNIKVYSTNAARRAYVSIGTTNTVMMEYVECYHVGAAAGAVPPGIRVGTTTGISNLTGVVVHDGGRGGWITGYVTTGSVTLTDCISWTTAQTGIRVLAWAGAGTCSIVRCIAGNCLGAQYGIHLQDFDTATTDCRAIGNALYGAYALEGEFTDLSAGLLTGLISHSNAYMGLWSQGGNTRATAITGMILWRNAFVNWYTRPFIIYADSPIIFGTGPASGLIEVASGRLVLITPSMPQDAAAFAPMWSIVAAIGNAEVWGGSLHGRSYVYGGDIIVNAATWTAFAPIVVHPDTNTGEFHLLSFRHNNVADDHRMYYRYGSVLSNAVTRHTASGLSWQHLPSGGAAVWFRPNIPWSARAKANVPVTVRAWVYTDASYDGTAKPRIVALGGYLAGVPSDVAGSSHTGAQQWEQLTATVTPTETGDLYFVVEGQGTTGSYYVDDVSAIGAPLGFADDYFGTRDFSTVTGVMVR